MYQKYYRKPFRDKLKIWIFIFLLIFIVIYFIFRTFNYFSGPKIEIISPKPYQIIKDDTFLVQGNVKNAKNIYLNGREISINENGDFAELLINKTPYTIVVVNCIDKYGKTKEIVFQIAKE